MENLEKKYQVFISSTYTDLIEERQSVVEGVLNAGHIPAGMESFKAGTSQEETIEEWIKGSDIYVLILGPRYGSLNKDGISYTQWEYNLAKEYNKPMFALVLTDDYINGMVQQGRILPTQFETAKAEYIAFKEEVMRTLVVQISHPAEIRGGISDSIRDIEKKRSEDLEGWIKGRYLKELEELRKAKDKLSEELLSSQSSVIEMQGELSVVKDDFIGPFKFEAVKQILMNDRPDSGVFKKMKKELEGKEDVESELKFIESMEQLNFNSLEMLMHLKSRLSTGGFKNGGNKANAIGRNYFTNFYISRWAELSLIEFKKPIDSKVKVYILSTSGKKFVSMIEMENLKSEYKE